MAEYINKPELFKRIEREYQTWADEYDIEQVLADIEDFPSADVQPVKHGKWLEFDSDEDKYDIIKCPCCKHTFTVDSYHWTDIGFVKDDLKFCPNCGADMRGEQDG